MTNLLPLETWRRHIGYNPWHFWQLSNTADVPVNSAANQVVYEYAWQNVDAVGRDDIRLAIETAEEKLRDYLGYAVAPRFTEQTLRFPRYHDARVWNMGNADGDGRWLSVTLDREGHVQSVGVESKTALELAVALVYTDTDGDGLKEDWAFTTAAITTETDIHRIAVYFAAADRLDGEGAIDRWLVQPVKVTINAGGTVTVRGKRWQVVKPLGYEGVDVLDAALDPAVDANFASTLDVYIRKTNAAGNTLATSQAKLIWETSPWPHYALCCGCDGSSDGSSDPAATAEAIARCGLRDAELGIVIPAQAVYNSTEDTWSATTWDGCHPPDRVVVRFRAGYPLDADGQMARKFQAVVARMAAAEMPNRLAAADGANRQLYHWMYDVSRAAGANDEQYQVSEQDINNPFGTRRGHIFAWRQVQQLRLMQGIAL